MSPPPRAVAVTDDGLVVAEGRYDRTDSQQGSSYLATIDSDGALTRLGPLPIHDVLEAGDEWIAYVPPGTVGGEAWTAGELLVQRRDGSGSRALAAPDERTQALARCRPDSETCEVVLRAG